jgi:hypothetical protein
MEAPPPEPPDKPLGIDIYLAPPPPPLAVEPKQVVGVPLVDTVDDPAPIVIV